MQITPLLAGLGQTTQSSGPRSNIAGDFNRFLTLLTTQLQNQDPLSPLDATEFTNQLVQFSQVEQTVHMNQRLANLLALQEKEQAGAAVAYIGKAVDALSPKLPLVDGEAGLFFAVDGEAKQVALNIYDDAGRLVQTLKGPAAPGMHRLTWNGTDLSGAKVKDGVYRMELVARDAAQKALSGQTGFTGRVDEVGSADGQIVLSAAGVAVPLTEVVAVRKAAARTGSGT